MQILLITFACIVVLFGILRLTVGRKARPAAHGETGEPAGAAACAPDRPEGCCGLHAVCERAQSKSVPAVSETDYYDDEELDAYAGRRPDSYTETEAAQFAYVMETMRPAEVSDWVRALHARGVMLPASLRPAALRIIRAAAGRGNEVA